MCAAGAIAVGTLLWQPGTLTSSIKIMCTLLTVSSVESPQAIRAAVFFGFNFEFDCCFSCSVSLALLSIFLKPFLNIYFFSALSGI